MTRLRWIHLAALLTVAACGAPSEPGPTPLPPPAAAPATAPPPAATAPEPPSAPEPPPPSAPGLAWQLTALPGTLPMAQRASFLLGVVATNQGAAVEHPIEHVMGFTVNGAPSIMLDFAFGNGISPMTWADLPPGASERSERAVGESLFPAPGDYEIVVTIDGAPHTTTVHVTP